MRLRPRSHEVEAVELRFDEPVPVSQYPWVADAFAEGRLRQVADVLVVDVGTKIVTAQPGDFLVHLGQGRLDVWSGTYVHQAFEVIG